MSGHSKWSTIKHKKARTDAERGKVFGRLIREITVATRSGGADPESNSRLRTAIQTARAANMPTANIERAIGKGSAQDGGTIEEIVYEGYGPSGVAVLVEVMTDNRNRTASEVRHVFSKLGGNLGESGCVAWMFDSRGSILVDRASTDEETLFGVAIEAGAADVNTELDDAFQVLTDPSELHSVARSLEEQSITAREIQLVKLPTTTVDIADESTAKKILKLLDELEDQDDVQHVWSNFDIPDEIIATLS